MKKSRTSSKKAPSSKSARVPIGRKFKSIDDYISHYPRAVQKLLTKVRATVSKAAPGAEEIISYNMPAFKLNGTLLYFAAHTSHIGFYPFSSGIAAFSKEFTNYKWARGSVQFPFDKPLPLGLIARIVKYRVKENALKMSLKKKKK